MSSLPGPRLLHGVKYKEGEFYLRCGKCWEANLACYWPLTLEFWEPKLGLTRCRACWATYRRRQKRARHSDARYYAEARDVILLKARERYQRRRDIYLSGRRDRYARQRAEQGKSYTPREAA